MYEGLSGEHYMPINAWESRAIYTLAEKGGTGLSVSAHPTLAGCFYAE